MFFDKLNPERKKPFHWQLEYGAEIGRAVTNFRGPIVFVVITRYHPVTPHWPRLLTAWSSWPLAWSMTAPGPPRQILPGVESTRC